MAKPTTRYFRKVFRITAEMSPNVRLARAQQALGQEPTGDIAVPGVLTWDEYNHRRKTWDPVRQSIGLDAEFWEGKDTLLFPPQWLNEAEVRAAGRRFYWPRRWLGVDSGEGGDKSAWTVIDRLGIVKQIARKTPDTAEVAAETINIIREYNIKAEDVLFDRGGGGLQHADVLRRKGFRVRTVGFGEKPALELKRGVRMMEEKRENVEDRYVFVNRRAQLYGEASLMFDLSYNPDGFGLPAEHTELRRQLALMPRRLDDEGRLYLPPKDHKPDAKDKSKETLRQLLGCSPDEADSFVLAVHAMLHKAARGVAGTVDISKASGNGKIRAGVLQ